MAINFTTLFTRLGKLLKSLESLNSYATTTIVTEVQAYADQFNSSNLAVRIASDDLNTAVESFQDNGTSALSQPMISSAVILILETVAADSNNARRTLQESLEYIISGMITTSDTVEENVISVGVTPVGANTGNGTVLFSLVGPDGLGLQYARDEGIIGVSNSSGLFTFTSERSVASTNPFFPTGSGSRRTKTSQTASSSSNRISNHSFETADSIESQRPSSWLLENETLGTNALLTTPETQTIVMSGTPTAGYYTVKWSDGTNTFETAPISYDAAGDAVQSAIRAITPLASIEVTASGTSPDFTHTIVMKGLENPAEFTSQNNTTGGSIAHATTVASTDPPNCMKFVENGALIEMFQPVTLLPNTVYCAGMHSKLNTASATGSIVMDLVGGVGGTAITNDAGTSNTITTAVSGMTTDFTWYGGFFQTPKSLPTVLYFRWKITVALVATRQVFLDQLSLEPVTQLYPGGPYVQAFQGETAWVTGDRVDVAVNNDYAGKFQTHFERLFNMSALGLQLPSAVSASETIADSLIA